MGRCGSHWFEPAVATASVASDECGPHAACRYGRLCCARRARWWSPARAVQRERVAASRGSTSDPFPASTSGAALLEYVLLLSMLLAVSFAGLSTAPAARTHPPTPASPRSPPTPTP